MCGEYNKTFQTRTDLHLGDLPYADRLHSCMRTRQNRSTGDRTLKNNV